jgi:two-component system, cell cycle response regulator DivK
MRSACVKILYIEDGEIYRRTVRRLIVRLGYEIITAENGTQGYPLAKQAIDLILMDVNLPDCDGLELVRRLRAENVLTPIVAVTGDVINVDRDDALQAGCNDFLAKPFESDELLQIVQAYVRRETPGSSSSERDANSGIVK